ncbi:hypothetical protein ABFS82_05G023100 [Erythranthe guttata]
MALNYSHRPSFPAHVSEDNLFSPMMNVSACLAEGVSETIDEGYARPWSTSWGEMEEWYFNCTSDRVHNNGSPEFNIDDVVNRLPIDPFRMGMGNTFTALTGWLEDLRFDYGGFTRGNIGISVPEDYGFSAGCSLIWKHYSAFQPFCGNNRFGDNLNVGIGSFLRNPQCYEKFYMDINSFMDGVQFRAELNTVSNPNQHGREGFRPACNREGILDFSDTSSELHFGEKVDVANESEAAPHEAMFFALRYLGVKDLLSVERVCRSLCSAVRGDPLLWMSIHIHEPLNEKITDDLLLQLARRAQGKLKCLSVMRCPKVTNDGIRRILETNTRLIKLFVPGSTRLTIEGILSNIKIHNSVKGFRGIKHLRIGGIAGVTRERFEEFKLLLGSNRDGLESHKNPPFFHRGNLYLPFDDDRALDIEMCPKCENYKLVYDCPSEDCQVKDRASSPACRGCTLCIPRCAQCGRCINDNEYEETFCLDMICLDCFEPPLLYQERLEIKEADSCADLHEPFYH